MRGVKAVVPVGKQFGEVTIVREVPSVLKGSRRVEAMCSCGTLFYPSLSNVQLATKQKRRT